MEGYTKRAKFIYKPNNFITSEDMIKKSEEKKLRDRKERRDRNNEYLSKEIGNRILQEEYKKKETEEEKKKNKKNKDNFVKLLQENNKKTNKKKEEELKQKEKELKKKEEELKQKEKELKKKEDELKQKEEEEKIRGEEELTKEEEEKENDEEEEKENDEEEEKENDEEVFYGKRKKKSIYRGVSKNNSGWSTRIYVGGEVRCLGTYKTQLEAAKIYDIAVIKMFLRRKLNFKYSEKEKERIRKKIFSDLIETAIKKANSD